MVRSSDDWLLGARLRHQTPPLPAAPGEDDIRVPSIDPEIVDYLQLRFPNTLPSKGTDIRHVDHLIGRREVVDHLVHLLLRQQENSLRGPR